jgi:hypothetical protein
LVTLATEIMGGMGPHKGPLGMGAPM